MLRILLAEQLYVGGETITGTWRMFTIPWATKVIGISPVRTTTSVRQQNTHEKTGTACSEIHTNQFHQNIHGIISDFALMMKPSFVIADGRKLSCGTARPAEA